MTDSRHHPPKLRSAAPQGSLEFEVRPQLGTRLVHVLVGSSGAFVSLLVTVTLIGRGTPFAGLAALALAVWCLYFHRLARMAVVQRGDRLVVRNLFSTYQLDRSAVREVSLAESHVAKSPNQTVVLHLADGRQLPLDACARRSGSRRARRRVDDFERHLSAWAQADATEGGPSAMRATTAGGPIRNACCSSSDDRLRARTARTGTSPDVRRMPSSRCASSCT